jgi:hypothetical protein
MPILQTVALTRRFGSLTAVDALTLDALDRIRHASPPTPPPLDEQLAWMDKEDL